MLCLSLTDSALVSTGVVDFVVADGGGAHLVGNHHLCLFHFVGVHIWQLFHVDVGWGLLLHHLVIVSVLHLVWRLSQVHGSLVNTLLLVGLNRNVTVNTVVVLLRVCEHLIYS